MTQQYELTVLFSPEHTSDALQKLQDKISQTITAHGGKIKKTDVWGRKSLAYRLLNKHMDAVFVFYLCIVDTSKVAELVRAVQLTDGVLRHLFVIAKDQT